MISRMKAILVIVMIIFGLNGVSFAMSCCGNADSKNDSGQAYAQDSGKESKATDVGNKICPITGETIQKDTKATYEYNGKIYNFCCSMCIPEFKKNPGKYIKKITEEKL